MYQTIRKQKTTRTLFADKMVSEGVLSQAESDEMLDAAGWGEKITDAIDQVMRNGALMRLCDDDAHM